MSQEGGSDRPMRFHARRLFYGESPEDVDEKHGDIVVSDDEREDDPDFAIPINNSDSESDIEGEQSVARLCLAWKTKSRNKSSCGKCSA